MSVGSTNIKFVSPNRAGPATNTYISSMLTYDKWKIEFVFLI